MPDRKVHVVLRKEDLDPERLAGKIVMVIDTLFATTTIVTALAHGAAEVLPALNHNEARDIARASGAGARSVLAGELHGEELPGFAQPTPQALSASGLQGKTVVYATTNGTVALRRAQAGRAVYAACLRNARATMVDALTRQPDGTLILLCAGSAGAFNIEDFYTAGVLVRHFVSLVKAAFLSDSAQAALSCSRAEAIPTLTQSRIGRRLAGKWRHEIEYAGQIDCETTVARLIGQAVVRG
jgi:2-phosphosulfolactate phosphatase